MAQNRARTLFYPISQTPSPSSQLYTKTHLSFHVRYLHRQKKISILLQRTNSKAMSTFSSCSSRFVFEAGNHVVVLLRLEPEPAQASIASRPSSPPIPLLIATPSDGGEFPVLLLLHGYLLYNSFYSHLLRHIASHGFIVVAPQVSSVISFHLSRLFRSNPSVRFFFLNLDILSL